MISDIAVLTRDRPASLSRALERSILDTQRLARSLRWHVFDDARDLSAVRANRDVVEQIRARFGASVSHVTRDDRLRWVSALVKEGAGTLLEDVARFALVGPEGEPTIGANRNAITLSLLDRQILCIDDDVIPVAGPMLGHEPGIRFEPTRDPTEFYFFSTREEAITAITLGDRSALEAHETLLGHTVTFPQALDTSGSSPGSRVVITMAGLAGDSGMGATLYYALLEGPSRERLVGAYDLMRTTRDVVRGVTMSTVCGARLLVGANLGLDLASWLPPFVPVGRNEEGPFVLALRLLTPDCYVGHVPYVVVHDPPGVRSETFERAIASVGAMMSSHLLMHCMGAAPREGHQTDPGARTARVGRFLISLSADADAFQRLVHKEAMGAQQVRLARLEDALASRTSEPSAWAQDIKKLLRAGEAAMSEPEYTLASDLEGDPLERRESLRERVRAYGRLLTQWPALRAAAWELERKGQGLFAC